MENSRCVAVVLVPFAAKPDRARPTVGKMISPPFDRLLAAQALAGGFHFVPPDPPFRAL